MPITLLTGMPGAGKSQHLITAVNEAAQAKRPVATFVCRDFPWPSHHGAYWISRRLVCRTPGLTCPLDHFVSAQEAVAVFDRAEPGTLIAVEEAYTFGPAAADDWLRASNRGLDVIVAAPSYHQAKHIRRYEHREVTFAMSCQRCESSDAVMVVIDRDDSTMSVCQPCFATQSDAAVDEMTTCLRDEHPYPGEDALYQPVEIPALSQWRLARPDSGTRAGVMADVLRKLDLLDAAPEPRSYLDIGCNTGFFCDYFASLGFSAKGVDATERFITVARLLDSYVRRQKQPKQEFVRYERANAYEYLQSTPQELFDVTSAFAVFQWVMIQRGVDAGLSCMEWLAAKTKHVCFIEFGYTREEMYQDQLDVEIDREWVVMAMKEHGDFADIHVVDAKPNGLQRDLFIGLKDARPTSLSF